MLRSPHHRAARRRPKYAVAHATSRRPRRLPRGVLHAHRRDALGRAAHARGAAPDRVDGRVAAIAAPRRPTVARRRRRDRAHRPRRRARRADRAATARRRPALGDDQGHDGRCRWTLRLRYEPRRLSPRYRLRIASGGVASPPLSVATRPITLAAFGDANFGDGVVTVMDQRGTLWPWRGSLRRCGAPTSRSATSSARSRRAARRSRSSSTSAGGPPASRRSSGFAGLDVLNLANNHAGDYGARAA